MPAGVYTFYADIVQRGMKPNIQGTFNRDVYCIDASDSNIETRVKVRLME